MHFIAIYIQVFEKLGRIHDIISRVRWAGAVTELRLTFSMKK